MLGDQSVTHTHSLPGQHTGTQPVAIQQSVEKQAASRGRGILRQIEAPNRRQTRWSCRGFGNEELAQKTRPQ